jgi:hypothetical protein
VAPQQRQQVAHGDDPQQALLPRPGQQQGRAADQPNSYAVMGCTNRASTCSIARRRGRCRATACHGSQPRHA